MTLFKMFAGATLVGCAFLTAVSFAMMFSMVIFKFVLQPFAKFVFG